MWAIRMLANSEWDGSTEPGLWLIRRSGEDMHLQAGKQTAGHGKEREGQILVREVTNAKMRREVT